MKIAAHSSDELRTLASLIAAATAVFICVYQQHFILSISEPASFITMTHHKCGLILLTSCAWCLVETANLLRYSRLPYPSPSPCCD